MLCTCLQLWIAYSTFDWDFRPNEVCSITENLMNNLLNCKSSSVPDTHCGKPETSITGLTAPVKNTDINIFLQWKFKRKSDFERTPDEYWQWCAHALVHILPLPHVHICFLGTFLRTTMDVYRNGPSRKPKVMGKSRGTLTGKSNVKYMQL